MFCSRHWKKLSDDPGSNLCIRKIYDVNKRAPSPLLTGVQRMPFGLCLLCQFSTGVLAHLLLKLLLGTESVGGPCEATVDFGRAWENFMFHPAHNPPGGCDHYK